MLQTKIQWTDATINFWTGCKKVSEGCKYCYMYRDKERYGQDPTTVIKVADSTINTHLRKLTEPAKIFTCSWSDFFIEEADGWRGNAWKIIRDNPQHQWQILTKRPERIADNLPNDWGSGYENVWMGVSIESQNVMEERLRHLCNAVYHINCKCKLFISAEPLLSDLTFLDGGECEEIFKNHIDWVIVGGESGNNKGKYRFRPCKITWMESIVSQCNAFDIPIFVKQMGTHLSKTIGLKDQHGGNINEFPSSLQIRQFPSAA